MFFWTLCQGTTEIVPEMPRILFEVDFTSCGKTLVEGQEVSGHDLSRALTQNLARSFFVA
jgi:hypothetical protein